MARVVGRHQSVIHSLGEERDLGKRRGRAEEIDRGGCPERGRQTDQETERGKSGKKKRRKRIERSSKKEIEDKITGRDREREKGY